jgi:NAD(P)-dependent dehydrogenase (short-subunit alcohol dehydrogenase family)
MFGAVEETSDDDVRANFETNFFAGFHLMRLVLPGMRTHGSGLIINVSSTAGFAPRAYLSAYSAAKSALENVSFCLGAEVKEFGVGVVVVAPGAFMTGAHKKRRSPSLDSRVARYRVVVTDRMREDGLAKKVGHDPNEVALVISDCLSMSDPPARIFVGLDRSLADKSRTQSDEESAWEMAAEVARY